MAPVVDQALRCCTTRGRTANCPSGGLRIDLSCLFRRRGRRGVQHGAQRTASHVAAQDSAGTVPDSASTVPDSRQCRTVSDSAGQHGAARHWRGRRRRKHLRRRQPLHQRQGEGWRLRPHRARSGHCPWRRPSPLHVRLLHTRWRVPLDESVRHRLRPRWRLHPGRLQQRPAVHVCCRQGRRIVQDGRRGALPTRYCWANGTCQAGQTSADACESTAKAGPCVIKACVNGGRSELSPAVGMECKTTEALPSCHVGRCTVAGACAPTVAQGLTCLLPTDKAGVCTATAACVPAAGSTCGAPVSQCVGMQADGKGGCGPKAIVGLPCKPAGAGCTTDHCNTAGQCAWIEPEGAGTPCAATYQGTPICRHLQQQRQLPTGARRAVWRSTP